MKLGCVRAEIVPKSRNRPQCRPTSSARFVLVDALAAETFGISLSRRRARARAGSGGRDGRGRRVAQRAGGDRRGERDVARDVIRDAALARESRGGEARASTADAEAAEEGDAGTGADETRGGAGGGGEPIPAFLRLRVTPATRELCRLREEAGTVAAELASVRDALDDVRAKAAAGTAGPAGVDGDRRGRAARRRPGGEGARRSARACATRRRSHPPRRTRRGPVVSMNACGLAHRATSGVRETTRTPRVAAAKVHPRATTWLRCWIACPPAARARAER